MSGQLGEAVSVSVSAVRVTAAGREQPSQAVRAGRVLRPVRCQLVQLDAAQLIATHSLNRLVTHSALASDGEQLEGHLICGQSHQPADRPHQPARRPAAPAHHSQTVHRCASRCVALETQPDQLPTPAAALISHPTRSAAALQSRPPGAGPLPLLLRRVLQRRSRCSHHHRHSHPLSSITPSLPHPHSHPPSTKTLTNNDRRSRRRPLARPPSRPPPLPPPPPLTTKPWCSSRAACRTISFTAFRDGATR